MQKTRFSCFFIFVSTFVEMEQFDTKILKFPLAELPPPFLTYINYLIFISILEWISKIVDGLYKVFFRTSKCKFRYLRNIYWLIWIKSEKFHPYIADFTPWTINIDIIFTISIIIETNTNLMTKFGHKHRTLNTSEWISSTTIDLPWKNWRNDSSDKARHRLKNVAEKATSEQRQSRLMRPVCRGFCFFWPPKEENRNDGLSYCNDNQG